MAVNIVTGMTGTAHITSDDDRAKNASIFGKGKYVLEYGKKFETSILSNNQIRVRDGMCMNQGTQMGIELNDYEDVIVENGVSGSNRNDLIVMRYERNEDTAIEKASLVVIKGTSGSTATDPSYNSGNILDGGELIDDMPLFRVKIESLSITAVEPLFVVFDSLDQISETVSEMIESGVNEKIESEVATDFSEAETPEFQQTIDDISNSVSELKSDLTQSNKILQSFTEHTITLYDICNLENGGIDGISTSVHKFRVNTKDILYFPFDIKLEGNDGFKYGYVSSVDEKGTEYEWSGWKTGTVIMPKGYCKLQIARVTENYSEIADLQVFGSSLKLSAYLLETNNTYKTLVDEFDIVIGSLENGKNSDSTTRVRTNLFITNNNSTISLYDNDYKFGVHMYDDNYSFIADSGWVTNGVYKITNNCKYFRVIFAKVDNASISSYVSYIKNHAYIIDDVSNTIKGVSKNMNKIKQYGVVIGSLEYGNNSYSDKRVRTNDYIKNNNSYVVFSDSQYKFAVQMYNNNLQFIADSGWVTSGKYVIGNNDCKYFRIICALLDNSIIFDSVDYIKDNVYVCNTIECENTELQPNSGEYYGEMINLGRHYCIPNYCFTMTHNVSKNIQGGACYDGYYFQFADYRENCAIYDVDKGKLLQLVELEKDTLIHCNNANFGNYFYDENDLFPLLYVSAENIDKHNVLVYRVSGSIGNFVFTLIQTITWDRPQDCNVYYPNCAINNDNNTILQIGYTENTYDKTTTNKIVINTFKLPNATDGDINLHDDEKIDTFTIDSLQSTQGCFIHSNKLYQVYGLWSDYCIKVIDLYKKSVVSSIDLTNEKYSNVIISEQEALFLHNEELYVVGVNKQVCKIRF